MTVFKNPVNLIQVCTKSASAPGDGVDNDCNGEIDEDTTCTEEDLSK